MARIITDHVAHAVDLINSLVYKPEWTFSAEAFNHRFEDGVKISVTYEARNSDRDEAPEYANWITGGARAAFVIQVGDCASDDAIVCKLLKEVILVVEEHEAREFLRYRDTLVSPFHPHRLAEMNAWGNPAADRTFGVA